VRPILEDLAEEMAASCADGTVPPWLTPQQVWIELGGRVRLLPVSLIEAAPAEEVEAGEEDQYRALHFLATAAVTALEGRPRSLAEPPASVRAPVPVHAVEILDRLLEVQKPYASVEQLQEDLETTRDRPAEVTRLRRAGHLALVTLLLHVPFMGPIMLLVFSFALLRELSGPTSPGYRPGEHQGFYGFALFCVAYWVVSAFLLRGGYAFWRGGIVLRRADGRKAWRLQCAWRALLVWAPVATLLCLAVGVAAGQLGLPWLSYGIWGTAAALLLAYVPLALWTPARGLHDRLAGTYLVPL
jgi:hypothetical protein